MAMMVRRGDEGAVAVVRGREACDQELFADALIDTGRFQPDRCLHSQSGPAWTAEHEDYRRVCLKVFRFGSCG